MVTAGDQGGYGATPDGMFECTAFSIQAMDATEAGAVFHGDFSYGVMRGLNTKDIATFASAVVALKCQKLGGRAGIPTLAETLQLLRQRLGKAFETTDMARSK